MPTTARNEFAADLRIAREEARRGVVVSRTKAADKTWAIWTQFCADLHWDPLLTEVEDPIPIFMVYARRVRDGRASKSGKPVKHGTVDEELRAVGQTMALLGARDPRLTPQGALDIRLRRQSRYFAKQDPAPNRTKPIPFPILLHMADRAATQPNLDQSTKAAIDMTIIAVFFLMRPGEYCNSSAEAHPFRLEDTQLLLGTSHLNLNTTPIETLHRATAVRLTFSTQKNSVRGEVIAQGLSGHPFFCPVRAVARRIEHLRSINAPHNTPLHFHRTAAGRLNGVASQDITTLLRKSVQAIGSQYGIQVKETTVRALRSTGAMALMCAKVDHDIIRLIGRWQSDAMLRYLHAQALPNMHTHARSMMTGGGLFSFGPPQPPSRR